MSQGGGDGAPARRNVAHRCRSEWIDWPAGSRTSRFAPRCRTARATASASDAETARTPTTWQARQVATDASGVTTAAPRPRHSATQRAASTTSAPISRHDCVSSSRTRRTAAAMPESPSIANPHSPASPPRRGCPAATSRTPMPRRFRRSWARGVITVPGAIRTSRVPAGSSSTFRRDRRRPAKGAASGRTSLRAPRPSSSRTARTAASTCCGVGWVIRRAAPSRSSGRASSGPAAPATSDRRW